MLEINKCRTLAMTPSSKPSSPVGGSKDKALEIVIIESIIKEPCQGLLLRRIYHSCNFKTFPYLSSHGRIAIREVLQPQTTQTATTPKYLSPPKPP